MAEKCAIYRDLLHITGKLRSQGYLRSYQGDLVRHDKATLKGYCGPYLWAITKSSTHLLTPKWACYGENHKGMWDSLADGRAYAGAKIYHSPDGTKAPQRVKGSVPGMIARKWEKACTKRYSMWGR
jgi:hypothetical protein